MAKMVNPCPVVQKQNEPGDGHLRVVFRQRKHTILLLRECSRRYCC